jgi:hypothetical protein
MGAPVPLDLGRPAPSWAVNLALKSWAPYWINCTIGVVNSSPSCRCMGIATSRPTCELELCPKAAIAMMNGDKAASHWQVRQRIVVVRPSFLSLRNTGKFASVSLLLARIRLKRGNSFATHSATSGHANLQLESTQRTLFCSRAKHQAHRRVFLRLGSTQARSPSRR